MSQLLPLYAFVLFGFIASRKLAVRKEAFVPLLIYILGPLLMLRGVLASPLGASHLALPLFVYASCALMCLLVYRFAPFESPARNILAFTAGNCNSGYFGIPVAVALLGEEAFAQAVMISFGFVLHENTIGFYITARGKMTPRHALRRVLLLPTAYAFLLGLVLRAFDVHIPAGIEGMLDAVRSTYIVLGMMLLGLALGDLKAFRVDLRFVGFALAVKFIAWPLYMLAVLQTGLFDRLASQGLMIVACLPLAANTVALATLHDAEPEKASVAVLVSTVLGIAIFPVIGPFVLAIR